MDIFRTRPTAYQLADVERRAGRKVHVLRVVLDACDGVTSGYMLAWEGEPRERMQVRLDAYIAEVYAGDLPRGILVD